MSAHDLFLQLVIILLGARLCAEIALRLNVPGVLGEIVAGIVLGPSVLGILEINEMVRLLAALGIVLLLFEAGLEADLHRLMKAGLQSSMVAVLGVALPCLFGFLAMKGLFGGTTLGALFVGGTLTATSIGITVRVLEDLKRRHGPESQIVLGAAVLDDIIGVVLLALLFDFTHKGTINFLRTIEVMVLIVAFLLLSPVAAKTLGRMLRALDARNGIPGLIPTMIMSLLLAFAWAAHKVGAPEMLGGFAAGLALSRQFFLPFGAFLRADPEFAHRVESQMQPIVQLFKPIFFVMVGLSLNLRAIDWASPRFWALTAALGVLAFAGKLLCGAPLVRQPWALRWAVGLAMVPRGEVGLIFAEVGRQSGHLAPETHAALVLVIALTTLLPPLLMRPYYRRFGSRIGAG